MCGIVACNTNQPAVEYLLPALRRLEYRGYDSAGVAVQSRTDELVRVRSVGRIDTLERHVEELIGASLGGVGIGHTRWATHGEVTEQNTHPHVDCHSDVHVVHNGIIENASELRHELALRGHHLAGDVDSETVAHLVEEALAEGADLVDAVDKAVTGLAGSWALAVVRRGDPRVVLTSHRSPLVVAVGSAGCYGASDITAVAGFADDVRVLEDRDLVVLTPQGPTWRRADGSNRPPQRIRATLTDGQVALGDAVDFMAKEIAEQPRTVSELVGRLSTGIADGGLWRELGLPPLQRVRFVACGTSLNAASVLARLLGGFDIPSVLAPASELDAMASEPGATVMALSQSGETADVLRALDPLVGCPLLAITNVGSSSLARSADAVVELGVGPEIGVAATKTFSAQVVAGAAVLLSGLVYSRRLGAEQAAHLVSRLQRLPDELALADDLALEHSDRLVQQLTDAPGFVFVGRGASVPYAREGALKLVEITYRWAECQPAGELKHGPIALIERGTPVVVVDDGHPKLAGSVAEMRTRGADLVTVGGRGSRLPYRHGDAAQDPWGPLPSVVVLQHLARALAVALGRDVDKPRNLAKSVTVE